MPRHTFDLLTHRFGKTLDAATAVATYAIEHPRARIAIVVPPIQPDRVLPLLWQLPEHLRPTNMSTARQRVTWGNGAVATLYNVATPDLMRGSQWHIGWMLSPADQSGHARTNLLFGLRLDTDPWIALSEVSDETDPPEPANAP